MVKKVIMNLDLSKASGPECSKNCEPELPYILAGPFNKCLKQSCFRTVGRSYQWSLNLRMLGNGL